MEIKGAAHSQNGAIEISKYLVNPSKMHKTLLNKNYVRKKL